MSPKDFRSLFLDRLLTFLWRQWSALGVLGDSGSEDAWIIDPEPLLVFSLEIARYEPRLFDEILAWLLANGEWLDTARLRRILERQDGPVLRTVGASFLYLEDHGQARKWSGLKSFCLRRKPPMGGLLEPLFKDKSGAYFPRAAGEKIDPSFRAFDLNHHQLRIQKKAKDVPVNARANLRFLARALFGIGAKSEAIIYLMTHESGHPRAIADAVGLYWLSLQQALADLSRSGLVRAKPLGKRLEYWLPQEKWWDFLASVHFENGPFPKWLNWIAVFQGLAEAWRAVDAMAEGQASDYIRSSKLQDSLEAAAQEFALGGFGVSIPKAGLPPDLHQKMALQFLGRIIDLKEEIPQALI